MSALDGIRFRANLECEDERDYLHTEEDRDKLLDALDAVLSLPHEDYCCTKGCPGYGNASCRILKPGETCDGSECTCMLSYPIRAINDALDKP